MSYILGSDDEITLALMETNHDDRLYFEIRLNENSNVVGHISYHFRDVKIFENVEVFISEEYRGNNYAKKALSILIENLYKIDNNDIYLSIHQDNIASIKSAISCGAKLDHVTKIPKRFSFSENGKYKYTNVCIIENNNTNKEKVKSKKYFKRNNKRRDKNDRY